MGAWLAELNMFAREQARARDLILVVHAGWNQERARGSSALGDWPDSIIYLTRQEDTDSDTSAPSAGTCGSMGTR